MELRVHLPSQPRREVDWTAAAISGFAAGAVLMVLELLWAASTSSAGPWRISQLIAALTMGSPLAAQPPPHTFDAQVVAVALLTHYALGIVFGLALGFVIARFHDGRHLGTMQAIGAAYGIALYVVNFYAVTALFPWFAELRGWSSFVAHLVFGLTAALLYWRLARRGGRPAAPL
jgi:ribose/xylose/arabinose/galactoside ABC-type transport system permease subunit